MYSVGPAEGSAVVVAKTSGVADGVLNLDRSLRHRIFADQDLSSAENAPW